MKKMYTIIDLSTTNFVTLQSAKQSLQLIVKPPYFS